MVNSFRDLANKDKTGRDPQSFPSQRGFARLLMPFCGIITTSKGKGRGGQLEVEVQVHKH